MSTVDLLIRVLADTSGAQQQVDNLISALGKSTGTGALGEGAAAAVTQSVHFENAMARIQTAYNSVDFAPGTARYQEAHDTLVGMSTKLATPFSTLAETYAQGARFVDEFGNKLDPRKLDEYTESVTRLSKVSKDLDPTRAGQLVETFAKVYRSTDFAGITSASSALSAVHNMGEGPALEGAIAIGQAGAEIGVRPEQALGIANALVDVGMSGQIGAGGMGAAGSAILRQMMLMQQSADAILDPAESFKITRQHREADERVDDVHESLEEAQARQAEMFDKHGHLRRQFRRHPSEKLALDHRVAKLQREEADARDDNAHFDELHAGGLDNPFGRGGLNIRSMAKTAGLDATAFAQLSKDDPAEALLSFTHGIGQLPEEARAKALRDAGLKNVRDLKIDEVMAGRDEVIRKSIGIAGGELGGNPTDLTTRSDIALGTTTSKAQDVINATQAGAAAAGDPARQEINKGLDSELKNLPTLAAKIGESLTATTRAIADSGLPSQIADVAAKAKDVVGAFNDLPPVVKAIVTAAAPIVLKTAATAPTPLRVGAAILGEGAQESQTLRDFQSGKSNLGQFIGHSIENIPFPANDALGSTIVGASSVDFSGLQIVVNHAAQGDVDAIKNDILGRVGAALDTALRGTSTPVNAQMGGAYTSSKPH